MLTICRNCASSGRDCITLEQTKHRNIILLCLSPWANCQGMKPSAAILCACLWTEEDENREKYCHPPVKLLLSFPLFEMVTSYTNITFPLP